MSVEAYVFDRSGEGRPRFAHHDRHVAAALAAGGFQTITFIEGARR